jgi:large subunit ribosomal protein L31
VLLLIIQLKGGKVKKEIHPKYAVINSECMTCNTKYEIGTTVEKISIDVCSSCHPFYNGGAANMKSTGRVERFNRMFGKTEKVKKEPAK